MDKVLYIAELNGKITGTIIVGFDNCWAWVYCFAVRPEFQHKGIGIDLLQEMHLRLKNRGAVSVNLVASPSNDSMRGLLKNIGYNQK